MSQWVCEKTDVVGGGSSAKQGDHIVRIRPGISGSTLKLIAIFSMLIDHIGAAILDFYLVMPGNYTEGLLNVRNVMRLVIGRMAFPIFCFLLTEGFQKTSNVRKYAVRLGIFALLSEIPFDLAFQRQVPDWGYQNVFLTLLFGLLAMMAIRDAEKSAFPAAVKVLLKLLAAGVFMGAAELLHTDYGAYGVLCILVMYWFRNNRVYQVAAGAAAFLIGDVLFGMGGSETLAPLGLLAVLFYDGRRGLKMKYAFYLFYPIHLLILAFLREVLL